LTHALVIGAGVNELVAAHTLARAGRQVLVIAEREVEEQETGWLAPQITKELELAAHGLVVGLPDPWISAPLPAGGRLELWRDMARSVQAIRALSVRDAASWPGFCERMARLARFLQALYASPAPDPMSPKFALRARALGRDGLGDLMRILPIPVADLLDDWFENDTLKGILASAGVTDLLQGPRSAGTAYRLLHHHVGSPKGVFRAPRSNIRQVLAGLDRIQVRQAQVARIVVKAGRTTGIVLATGEEIEAPLVISGSDAGRVLLDQVEPGWLDPELARAIRNIRRRGVAARVQMRLERAPDFSTLLIAPSLDYLERAYDDAKHGALSRQPWLEAQWDQHNQLEVRVQYAPYRLRTGSWDAQQAAALGAQVSKTLAPHLGGASIVETRVASPMDLERMHGWPQGQPHHAELALDQALWMRPVPALAAYRTPIDGLFLCGAGMHPGAEIPGAAGRNCARAVLGLR
jgi:phytoene dehydrogenase-like protein